MKYLLLLLAWFCFGFTLCAVFALFASNFKIPKWIQWAVMILGGPLVWLAIWQEDCIQKKAAKALKEIVDGKPN